MHLPDFPIGAFAHLAAAKAFKKFDEKIVREQAWEDNDGRS